MESKALPEYDDMDCAPFELCGAHEEPKHNGKDVKSCFLCNASNVGGATKCHYCGMNLAGDPMDAIARERAEEAELVKAIDLEISAAQHRQAKLQCIEVCGALTLGASRRLVLMGLALAPYLVGVPIVLAGAAFQHLGKKVRDKARVRRTLLEKYVTGAQAWATDHTLRLDALDDTYLRLWKSSR